MSTASHFQGDLAQFLKSYVLKPELTRRLDNLQGMRFTQELVNEIVLWKVDRYVELDDNLLAQIEGVRSLKQGQHRRAETVLTTLLEVHGVDLAMASTILRFRNPSVFQIIDRHAYRALYGVDYPLHTKSCNSKKISMYFEYVDGLLVFCRDRHQAFETVDRLLYIFDKKKNGKL